LHSNGQELERQNSGCDADWTVDELAVLWEWADLMQRSPCLLATHFQHKTCADVSARLLSSAASIAKHPQSERLAKRTAGSGTSSRLKGSGVQGADSDARMEGAGASQRQVGRSPMGQVTYTQHASILTVDVRETEELSDVADDEAAASRGDRQDAGASPPIKGQEEAESAITAWQMATLGESGAILGTQRSVAPGGSVLGSAAASLKKSSEPQSDEEGPAATSDGVGLVDGMEGLEDSTQKPKLLKMAPKRRKRNREVVIVK
jgi:hypothetical protein